MFRYSILFPLRFLGLIGTFTVFFAMFFSVKAFMPPGRTKLAVEQRLIRFMCGEPRGWGGGGAVRGGACGGGGRRGCHERGAGHQHGCRSAAHPLWW